MQQINYDIQQVCVNGHQITGSYNTCPEERKNFCQRCGATTITACPSCGIGIKGAPIKFYHQRKTLEDIVSVPSYCAYCGKPYPWTQQKNITTAIQILMESGNLNGEEKTTIEQDVENIAKDVPETELSARRIKHIWERCSKAGYEVIMELASRTAANILKGP